MGERRIIEMPWPAKGLHRRFAYQQQPPHTTPDCVNVRPSDVLEGRIRGGSRPGLAYAYEQQISGASKPIRLLANFMTFQADGYMMWVDDFDIDYGGTDLASCWTEATDVDSDGKLIRWNSWASTPPCSAGDLYTAMRDKFSDFDDTQPYTISIYCVPNMSATPVWNTAYYIYFRTDDNDPYENGAEVRLRLYLDAAKYYFEGHVKSYDEGVEDDSDSIAKTEFTDTSGGWLTALVNVNNVQVYWQGTLISSTDLTLDEGHTQVGMGIMPLGDPVEYGFIDAFQISYYRTAGSGSQTSNRYQLVASADGELWYRADDGNKMSQLSTSLTLASDRLLQAAGRGGKLYIADWSEEEEHRTTGTISNVNQLDDANVNDWRNVVADADKADYVVIITNGTGSVIDGTYQISSVVQDHMVLTPDPSEATGTCTFRVIRAPKVYDPFAGTLTIWSTENDDDGDPKGQVPSGCPLICNYRDRLVLGGDPDAPQVWYMSRQGNPLDFDYAAENTDPARAVAGIVGDASSEAGVPSDGLTALIPASSDYLVMATGHSLYVLRGDPAYGGILDCASRTIGCISQQAWCHGPAGEVVFLSRDGLYALAPGINAYPQSLSREILPRELVNVNTDTYTPILWYDVGDRGIHICITPVWEGDGWHYWYDWETKGFWPASYDKDFGPTALTDHLGAQGSGGSVLWGGRDGYIRFHRPWAVSDCGTNFTSYAIFGPYRTGNGRLNDGMVLRVVADVPTDVDAADINWYLWCRDSSNEVYRALTGTSCFNGTFGEGVSKIFRPNARGGAFAVKLESSGGEMWTIEGMTAVVEDLGEFRNL